MRPWYALCVGVMINGERVRDYIRKGIAEEAALGRRCKAGRAQREPRHFLHPCRYRDVRRGGSPDTAATARCNMSKVSIVAGKKNT